jgi:hypothetical protein
VPTPNFQPNQSLNQETQPNRNLQHLLVGGIVGYLIGRRRGRIKTERRMNAVVKKLEKQVAAKQQEIDFRVQTAERKARDVYRAAAEKTPERPAAEKPLAIRPESDSLNLFQREVAVPIAAAERRTPTARGVETRPKQTTNPERPKPPAAERQPVNIELKDEDVMRLSETINIGATNLKNVFEAKLITKSGLRRLVREHLEGRDVRRGLAREFLAKELSYERDPKLRDLPVQTAAAARGGGAASATGSDTATPSSAPPPAHQPSAPPAAATDTTASALETKSQQPVSTGLLAALTLIAFGLAAFAVLLALIR